MAAVSGRMRARIPLDRCPANLRPLRGSGRRDAALLCSAGAFPARRDEDLRGALGVGGGGGGRVGWVVGWASGPRVLLTCCAVRRRLLAGGRDASLTLIVVFPWAGMTALVVNYHKTGFAATALILQVLSHAGLRISRSDPADARSFVNTSRLNMWCKADMAQWWAADAISNPAVSQSCFDNVLHFVRHPARWTVSFYDYHRQRPNPEKWTEHLNDLCSQQPAYAEMYKQEATLHSLQADCYARFGRTNQSLYSYFQLLPEPEGLRLALYFLLFGGDPFASGLSMSQGKPRVVGGDILRATINSKLFRAWHFNVTNLDMDSLLNDPTRTITDTVAHLALSSSAVAGHDVASIEKQWCDLNTKAMNRKVSQHITSRPGSSQRKSALACSLVRHTDVGDVIRSLATQMLYGPADDVC